jgi:hypothetical protein
MGASEQIHVDVAAAVLTDEHKQVLLTLNDNWGAFTLPMTRRRRSARTSEPPARAAIRAAVGAIGVPVRLKPGGPKRRPGRLPSDRELAEKVYNYDIFPVEPHPDFAGRLQIRQPHLWLSPHLIISGIYQPISESARFILRSVLADFEIPMRIQHSSALVIARENAERGHQFLVRWNSDWGYALPAKRWDVASSVDPNDRTSFALEAAKRVVREELGLDPAVDPALTLASVPEVTTHGLSKTKDSPAFDVATEYIHTVFRGKLRSDSELNSRQPLAWVTQEEIHEGHTAGSHPATSTMPPRAAAISRTVYDILLEEGLIAEIEPPSILFEADEMARRIQARLDEQAAGIDP